MISSIFDGLGGRKFIGLIVVAAAGILVDIFGPHGLSSNLSTLLGVVYGVFAAGNVVATWATTAANNTPTTPETNNTNTQNNVDLTPLNSQLDLLAGNAKMQSEALAYVVDFVKKVSAGSQQQ